jgi:inositol phosphorylceramide mannosyltransferase catalytic subunit
MQISFLFFRQNHFNFTKIFTAVCKWQNWLLCFLLSLNLLVAEDRTNNPLYKALPPIGTTLEGLLALKPKTEGFTPISFRESLAANWVPTEPNFFEDIGVQIAEKKFVNFCQAQGALGKPSSDFSIPPVIHLIWLGSTPPPTVDLAIASWKKYHPKWEIILWTDEKLKKFSWSNARSEDFFKEGKNWAEKSDILRFEILYQFGGIYSDTDVICLKSFEGLVTRGLTFFAGFESNKIKRFGRPLIGSAIIGAAKNSSVIKRCIDYSQSAKEAPSIHQHIRSGPGPMSKASYEALEAGQENILLLPCSYLYPLPWEKRLAPLNEIIENIRPESFAIHLWEGSWFDSYHPPKSN